MLGADVLREGPPFSPGTSFSSTRFSQYGGSSRRTEAGDGPRERNIDLETGEQEPELLANNTRETRMQIRSRGGPPVQPPDTPANHRMYAPTPGHGAGAVAVQIQGFGQERANNDGECFFYFLKNIYFN